MTRDDLAAPSAAKDPAALPCLSEEDRIRTSDALLGAARAGRLARSWATYTAGPRKGERVLVLSMTKVSRLPNGDVVVEQTPLAEILQHPPFACLEHAGEVTDTAAPRIVLP